METWLSENWHLFLFFTAFGGLLWRVFSRYSEIDKRVTLLERDIKHGSKQFDKISESLVELRNDVHELKSSMKVIVHSLRNKGIMNGRESYRKES